MINSEQPTLLTIENATKQGNLDRFQLLREAEKGQDTLEVLVYVDYKDIAGGVNVSSMSCEPGYYLALPDYIICRLIEKGDAHIDSFQLPKAYLPPCAGLVLLQQILAESKDGVIRTKEPLHIKTGQEKLWVVSSQVESFFKKRLSPQQNELIISPETQKDDFITGRKALCKTYGVGPKSFNAVVRQAKKCNLKFDYEQGKKGEPSLRPSEIIILKANKGKKIAKI